MKNTKKNFDTRQQASTNQRNLHYEEKTGIDAAIYDKSIMTPTENSGKDLSIFKVGQNVSKTQRQQTIDKNFQIQAGISNPSKVTLNPNGKHGVMVTTVAGSTATNQSRNMNANSQYYAPMQQSMTAVGTPSKNQLSLAAILSSKKQRPNTGRISQSAQRRPQEMHFQNK